MKLDCTVVLLLPTLLEIKGLNPALHHLAPGENDKDKCYFCKIMNHKKF